MGAGHSIELSTQLDERHLVGMVALKEESESLVDRTDPELGGVVAELGRFLGLIVEEAREHFRHTANATTQRRVGKHVDEGAGRVRYLDARAAAPDGLHADESRRCHRVQLEAGLAQQKLPLARARGCHHADRTKKLLGEPPMLGGGPPADVARREHRCGDRPCVVQCHIGRLRLDGYRDVRAAPNTYEPSRSRPRGETASSDFRRQPEGGGGMGWRHDGWAVAQQFAQLTARHRAEACGSQALYLIDRSVNHDNR